MRRVLQRLLDSFGSSAHTGLEITSAGVCGVSVARGRSTRVTGMAWEPLAPGVVRPAAAEPNVLDAVALRAAVERVLERLGRPRRIALVVPDAAGKVSILNLESIPKRRVEVEQVVRWQIAKAVPFPVETAQVAWTEGSGPGENGHRLLVVVMRRDVVEEYESVCRDAGAHAGIVGLSTFDVVNAVLGAQPNRGPASGAVEQAWMLVHLAPESTSLAIVRGGRPIFYRSRAGSAESEVVDAIHQSAMYFEDRLGGGGFDQLLAHVSGDLAAPNALWSTVESRLGMTVEMVDPRLVVDFGVQDVDRARVAAATAPVGVLLRG